MADSLVAVCMATYNPPIALFRRQIESIRNQSLGGWTCFISDDRSDPDIFEEMRLIIGDDPRFVMSRGESRLDFYRNFERSLHMAEGGHFDFIALCDQDDYWYPEKLETLASGFSNGVNLVYADLRTVDPEGKVLSESYWGTRENNYRDFSKLFLANTVTGAASMFRADLLKLILPFPRPIGEAFHDHWIALVSSAIGDIEYFEEPLHDYVQHSGNVIGHAKRKDDARHLRNYLPTRANLRRTWGDARAIYTFDVLRLCEFARELETRLGDSMPPDRSRTVRRFARMDVDPRTIPWMGARAVGSVFDDRITMGAERRLFAGLMWSRVDSVRHRAPWVNRLAAQPPTSGPADTAAEVAYKISPVSFRLSSQPSRRVNILIPHLDLSHFFGGYLAKFNLGVALAKRGYRVRMVAVDPGPPVPEDWPEILARYEGLEDVGSLVELVDARNSSRDFSLHSKDLFVASTFWTAHIAHTLCRSTDMRAFLYLIQEYEPLTFPNGTWSALARQSYEYPHRALFSTDFLREYFQENKLGVFAECREDRGDAFTYFNNAITPVLKPTADELRTRSCRRLLFYARPEPHASRNLYDLGIIALRQAVDKGIFDDEAWEFYGVGSSLAANVDLGETRTLVMLPRQNQDRYAQLLPVHDLGLSLMDTPHPSLVPLEMASAGMPTVTSTYCNKTAAKLRGLSPNLIGVAPTIESVVTGLGEAAHRCRDENARVQGSAVDWPTSWKEALNPAVMDKVCSMLGALAG